MKYLKSYESIGDQFFKTYKETKNWLDLMKIKNYQINDNLVVDVYSTTLINDVNLSFKNLKLIPVQFGNIDDGFYCNNNHLVSLKGCPISAKNLNCSNNELKKLEYCTKNIKIDFYCSNNKLTTLKGITKNIGRSFYCDNNQLTDFKFIPEIKGGFNCSNNPIYELYQLFDKKICIKWINDYDVIKGNTISLDSLKEVIYIMDIKQFNFEKLYKFKNYIIV